MENKKQKNRIQIIIAGILILITLLAIYGFGWVLSAEQNLLLALNGLPENQKWHVSGNLSILFEQLDEPISFDFSGELDYGGGRLDSRWRLENDVFGSADVLRLAKDSDGWLVELPTLVEGEIWHLAGGGADTLTEKLTGWIKELQFQKKGYRTLEREYGGSVSCLNLVSSVNILPMKFIEWLEGLSEKDLSLQRKQELQEMIEKNMAIGIECYITPDLKFMEMSLTLSLRDGITAEIFLKARPEKGVLPSLEYYQGKARTEVDAAMLEELLQSMEEWKQEAE